MSISKFTPCRKLCAFKRTSQSEKIKIFTRPRLQNATDRLQYFWTFSFENNTFLEGQTSFRRQL